MWVLRLKYAATAVLFFALSKRRDGSFVSAQIDAEIVSTECSTSDMVGYDYKVNLVVEILAHLYACPRPFEGPTLDSKSCHPLRSETFELSITLSSIQNHARTRVLYYGTH